MMNHSSLVTLILLVMLTGYAKAQDIAGCGEAPAEPAIVDGANSKIEQLIANSEEVNAFIEEIDKFLDCKESRYSTSSLARRYKEDQADEIKSLTARRNAISDEFNAQIEAYKAANP